MMWTHAAAAVLAAGAIFGAGPAVAESEFRLMINGLRNDQGSVRVAIYRTAATFATEAGLYRSFVAPARQGSVEVVFDDLPTGIYGVAAFHDENDNNEFDQTFLGLPAEGFGFGNDAPVRLSAPSFREAAVIVDAETVHGALTIRYW